MSNGSTQRSSVNRPAHIATTTIILQNGKVLSLASHEVVHGYLLRMTTLTAGDVRVGNLIEIDGEASRIDRIEHEIAQPGPIGIAVEDECRDAE